MDYNPLLILVFVFVTSCQAQSFPPTDVTAVYMADGSITVTWGPPVTTQNIQQYSVEVHETGEYHYTESANDRVYLYHKTKPGTTYTFEVNTVLSNTTIGSSQTHVTTPAAIFGQRGSNGSLTLPKPPSGISAIGLSGRTLFVFVNGEVHGISTIEDGITVRLTTTNAILDFEALTTKHAGYYYTMRLSGNVILGGQLLVVTDTPSRPNITPSSRSPVLDTSVTLKCISTSRSKPDSHGLVLTSSWKLNGSDVTLDRFSVNGSNLVIDPVRLIDKYNVYTCVAHEDGQGSRRQSSEESSGFQLTPRYGPQFVTIEGAEGRSPLIRGDVYGPVICRTDCNPACVLEWRRQGNPFIPSRRPFNNQLQLMDGSLPRTRAMTYTCKARVSSSAGFTATLLEKNITVDVYFPPNITALSYLDEVDEHRPIGREDIRYREGFELVIRVDVDGNPNPDVIILLRNQTTIAVGVPTTAGIYDVQLSDNLQYNHTGRYQVRAANFVTRNRSNVDPAVRTFGLQVNGSPRRQGTMNSVIGVTGKKGQTIALNVTVLANPTPTSRWSTGVRSLPVIPNNAYMYTIRGEVLITEQSDFREYHVNVTNGIGGKLMVKFEIRPPGVPDKPIDFRASYIGHNIIKVAWTSEFNGGISQHFHIDFMIVGNEWLPVTANISDAGQGALMAYTLHDITPATYYAIRLNVSNQLGSGISSQIWVRTLEIPLTASLTFIILISIIGILVVAPIIAILVVVIRRRRRQQAKNSKAVPPTAISKAVPTSMNSKKGPFRSKNICMISSMTTEMDLKPGPMKVALLQVMCSQTMTESTQSWNRPQGRNICMTNLNTIVPPPVVDMAGPSRAAKEDGLVYINVEISAERSDGKGVISGEIDRTQNAFFDSSQIAPNST